MHPVRVDGKHVFRHEQAVHALPLEIHMFFALRHADSIIAKCIDERLLIRRASLQLLKCLERKRERIDYRKHQSHDNENRFLSARCRVPADHKHHDRAKTQHQS